MFESKAAPGRRRLVETTPPVYETPLELLQGLVTPTSLFFLRNHYPTPAIDTSTWRLRIEGSAAVRHLELSYEDILNMPSSVQTTLLECAGNGRELYGLLGDAPIPGAQWRLGGVSVGEWTGVLLAEVLGRAGIKPGATEVLLEGLDQGRVERPIPLSVALDPKTLLAYGMNGEVLPPDHGFPLRAIVPAWAGISSIKWLGRIAIESAPVKTRYNSEVYILKGPDYPGDPAVTHRSIKSVVALPWSATIPAGLLAVRGYAWSPYGRIASLEYSLDVGQTWAQARLLEPNAPLAWTRWEFLWRARPGNHAIMTRTTDEKGNRQPDKASWNEQGYLYNAMVPHPVRVV